jgi:hypothetical protein
MFWEFLFFLKVKESWNLFELSTIWKLGKPYLERRRIFGYLSKSNSIQQGEFGEEVKSNLPFALRLHQFFWGGYTQMRIDKDRNVHYETFKAPSFNFIRHSDYHMVTHLYGKPRTLFFTGPKVSDWGFLVNGEHMNWKRFLGIEPDEQNCYYCGAIGTNKSYEEHLLEWGSWQLCHRHKSERSSPSE